MLLSLPPELLQLVLFHVPPASILQAAFSCRTVLDVLTSSRALLVHHLEQIPGAKTDVDSLQPRELFRLLLQRSAEQLYGAQFHGSREQLRIDGQVINVRASSFAASGDPNLALAVRNDGVVRLYHASAGKVTLRKRLTPPWDPSAKVRVLKTAFSPGDGVYVLQRVILPNNEYDPDADHPFVKHAIKSGAVERIYLVHYPSSEQEMLRICSFPDHFDCEPVAFAAAGRDAFVISWKHLLDSEEHEVALYNNLEETKDDELNVMNIHYDLLPIVAPDDVPQNSRISAQSLHMLGLPAAGRDGPVTELAFNGPDHDQLLHYYQTQAVYGTWQRINVASTERPEKLYSNTCIVQFSYRNPSTLLFSIGMPFFGTHQAHISPNHLPLCRLRYLAVGIAKHPQENWTVACLLASEAVRRADHCSHGITLERGRRTERWEPVARLWGYQELKSSVGCILAASPQGTRIAVANWKVIYVWALNPTDLVDAIEENSWAYYPKTWASDDGEKVELRPVVLRSNAVCFKLRFLDDENHLLALTDHGLMYWDLNPLGKGTRTTRLLAT